MGLFLAYRDVSQFNETTGMKVRKRG